MRQPSGMKKRRIHTQMGSRSHNLCGRKLGPNNTVDFTQVFGHIFLHDRSINCRDIHNAQPLGQLVAQFNIKGIDTAWIGHSDQHGDEHPLKRKGWRLHKVDRNGSI